MKKENYVLKITVSGLMLAIGILIPRMFHTFGTPELGKMFLPMHLSVFIAGVFLGKYYGLGIGFLTPLLNSLFGMPQFPISLIMAFELAAYGFFSGMLANGRAFSGVKFFGKSLKLYIGLLFAMIIGRVIYGLALYVSANLLGMEKLPKPLSIIAATITGIPGILLQLTLVPAIVYALRKVTEEAK